MSDERFRPTPSASELRLLEELHSKLTTLDCARASGAFRAVLAAAGVDPWSAALAFGKLESWDRCGVEGEDPLTEGESRAASAWLDAIAAAHAELCEKAPHLSRAAFDLISFLNDEPVDPPWFSLGSVRQH